MAADLAPKSLWTGCVLLLAVSHGACRTTPPASPAPVPAPTSIAYRIDASAPSDWTTAPREGGPSLRRRDHPAGVRVDSAPPASGTRRGSPSGVGSTVERRLEGGYATAGPWELYVTTSSTYVFGGDLSNGERGIDTWINGWRVGLEKPLDSFGRLGINAGYAVRSYHFEGGNSLVAGTDSPFDLVHSVLLGANIFQPVSESWAVLVNADASVSAEMGADLLDGFSWSVTVGGGHRVSESLDVGAGVYVADRFEEDLLVFGGPQFDWRVSKQWEIELIGSQLSVTYRPDDAWEWGISGGFDSARFRLDDGAPDNSQIVTDSRLPVYLRLRYRGGSKNDLELRVGADVYRDIVIEDARGRNARGVTADVAPFVGLRWILRL